MEQRLPAGCREKLLPLEAPLFHSSLSQKSTTTSPHPVVPSPNSQKKNDPPPPTPSPETHTHVHHFYSYPQFPKQNHHSQVVSPHTPVGVPSLAARRRGFTPNALARPWLQRKGRARRGVCTGGWRGADRSGGEEGLLSPHLESPPAAR